MRARRVAVARDVGRRRRRRLNAVLGVVAVVVWSLVGLRSGLVDVDRVQVEGATHTSEAAVRAALAAGPGTPMVEVDGGAAEGRLEALPWVEAARVRRLWPGTVRVVLTERTAVAAVPAGERWALVDADGRVLATVDGPLAELAALPGVTAGAPGTTVTGPDRDLLRTLGDLPSATRARVDEARRGGEGIVLDLAGGACVVLGDRSDLDAKAMAAEAVLASVDGAATARIDVRVATAPALTPRGRCA
jgi:cell division protein FtsQ